MTAHPDWPQSRYDAIFGLFAGRPAVGGTRRRYQERRASRSRQENHEDTPNMRSEARKITVVGGNAGMVREVAVDIVRHGGSAVIVGRPKGHVDDTVADPTGRRGHARWDVAELIDAVKSCLTGYECTTALAEFHCGEANLVIKHLFAALLSTQMGLPVTKLSKLTGRVCRSLPWKTSWRVVWTLLTRPRATSPGRQRWLPGFLTPRPAPS